MGTDNFDETVSSIFSQEEGAGSRFLQVTCTCQSNHIVLSPGRL